jgi:uncharacterized protein
MKRPTTGRRPDRNHPRDGHLRVLDLGGLELLSGSGTTVTGTVPTVPIDFSGQRYEVLPRTPEVTLELSRSGSGWFLVGTSNVVVEGPCWRCLGEAELSVHIRGREFQAHGRKGEPFDEDFDSQYFTGDDLDVEAWLRDAVNDALPAIILCREGCQGLCATCGADRNGDPCACDRPRSSAGGPFVGLTDRLRGQNGSDSAGA